jgi:signal transduction histidine kinase
LEYANATKNKFFSIIAHDLKNPFYTIIGFTEMLMKNLDTNTKEDQLKYLSMIYNSGKDAHNLLENLLNWSRLQIGTIKANKVMLSSVDIIDRVIHFLEPMAKKKSIELVQQEDDEYEILADEEMLQTILRNLGSNAIKFSPEEGIVRFITKTQNGDNLIHFIVEDNGIGMSDEIIKNLFQIDAKQSRKGTSNESGTGLGLILCKEFSEYHQGSLKIESEEGKGSRFTVILPVNEN